MIVEGTAGGQRRTFHGGLNNLLATLVTTDSASDNCKPQHPVHCDVSTPGRQWCGRGVHLRSHGWPAAQVENLLCAPKEH